MEMNRTSGICYRTELRPGRGESLPPAAAGEDEGLPPQLEASFLGMYMPFNNKFIAHARRTAIKREEIEYNRLRRR